VAVCKHSVRVRPGAPLHNGEHLYRRNYQQFYEGGCNGGPHLVPNPADTAAVAARKKAVRDEWTGFFSATANRFRTVLGQHYGKERAEKIRFAEAFEICEYGRKPDKEVIKQLFPFFGA
jgi:N-acetylglucosamine malate deacetylase 1